MEVAKFRERTIVQFQPLRPFSKLDLIPVIQFNEARIIFKSTDGSEDIFDLTDGSAT